MIERLTKIGPHLIHVEERVNKRTKKPLPAKQTFCHRPIHEVFRCPHGERTWCVGAIRPGRSEVEETMQQRFGCTCTIE